jgi:hypothetical protein
LLYFKHRWHQKILEENKHYWAGGVNQAIELLHCEHEALRSKSNAIKKKKKRKKEN